MPVHDRFDAPRWISHFSLERLRARARAQVEGFRAADPSRYPDEEAIEWHARLMGPKPGAVTSPVDVAIVEQLRVASGGPPSTHPGARAVDVAVFSKGESSHPAATKFGGVPFLARETPWPRRQGKPLPFLGQLCFADSRDLVPRTLPGDVLMMFGELDSLLMGEHEAVELIWAAHDRSDALIDPRQMPDTGYRISPCFASLHRTIEWPSESDDWRLATFEATKLGGIPRFIQEPPEQLRDPAVPFLGTFGAVQPAVDIEFPWLNQPEPIPLLSALKERWHFSVGDAGNVNVFLRGEELVWDAACY